MSEVIVVTSGKGGVGKTTTTANVGTGLAMLGKKVVRVDTDIGLRNLDVVMGLENRIVYNLVDVIEGNCRMKQALIRDKKYHTLYLLPSAQTRDKNAVNPEQMKKLTDELREDFDYILLYCPAGIEQGFLNADRIIGLLESDGMKDIRLVINRLRPDMISRGDMMSVKDVSEILGLDMIGAVPDDENIVISTNQGNPLVGSESPAGQAYMNISRRVDGKTIPFMKLEQKKRLFRKRRNRKGR